MVSVRPDLRASLVVEGGLNETMSNRTTTVPVFLVLSLTACSSSESQGATPTTEASESRSATSTAPARAQASATPGPSKSPVPSSTPAPSNTPVSLSTVEVEATVTVPPAATLPPAPTSPPVPAGVSAAIQSNGFPYQLAVAAGSTVVWTNNDPVLHDVTANDGDWTSGLLSQGESFSHTFDTPGKYPYVCKVHPFMTAVLIVE